MSSIDQRIVQMQFDNRAFEAGIATTLGSLNKLQASLKLKGASDGLDQVGKTAKGFSLDHIAQGVDSVAEKFHSMGIVGIAALSNITSKIVDTGIEMVKSFTIGPIMDGFHNYETQINAVQTIMANTGLKGAAGLAQVNKVLAELNTYANQTVYNFSDMAKNIGTFTAAGVKLDVATSSIKGIANLAALSGASAEQASGAMYQLSQAIAAGSVKLQDWNSVVNAGLGGKVFQNALVDTARASGVSIDAIIKKAGSFRESLQKGWLTSNILTKTLSQFTGDLSLKQIEAMGYTKKQAQQIYELSQTAVGAATKIKTFTQLTQALKEEVATAYAAIFKTIFGNITTATDLFTNIHNVAENALTKPIYALNTLLEGWDKLGGRKALIDGLTAAVKVFSQVIGTIKDAFREVFPPTTAKQLYDMTVSFRNFMERLKMGGQTVDELKRTFAGVFAILKIGWDIVSAVAKALLGLFDSATSGSGGFLKVTATIGDFLVHLESVINKSQIFTKIFSSIGSILSVPIQLLGLLGGAIGNLFGKFDGDKTAKGLHQVGNELDKASKVGGVTLAIWNAIVGVFKTVASYVSSIAKAIGGFFHGLGNAGSSSSQGFWSVLSFLQTLLAGGFLVTLTRFMKLFENRGGGGNPVNGIIHQLIEPFDELTKTLKTMQTTLRAATLLEIAAAVAILALAMHEIAGLNQEQLTRSGVAITAMMGQLIGSLMLFQKFTSTSGFIKMPFMMASLLLFAGAITVLAKAVTILAGLDWNSLSRGLLGLAGIMGILAASLKLIGNPKGLVLTGFGLTEIAGAIGGLVLVVTQLAGLSWDGLAKGLTGLAGILGTLILFTKFADASNAGAIRSVGLILLAAAIKVLVSAVKDFAGMSWQNIAKGLTGVATLLGSLVLYTKFSDANKAGIAQGVGIVLLASGIKILVSAVKDFANMSWENISKGLVSVGVLLGSLTLFTKFSSADKAGVIQGAGIVLIAAAIKILASAVKDFAAISWEGIAKGLLATGIGLGAFALALKAIPPSSVISAVGVLIVATSMEVVANAMKKLGQLSWESIAKGLIVMGIALDGIAAALDLLPPSSLLSAAAIFVVASSLGMIADALVKMGGMSWNAIAKSLVELAGSLVIIAAAMAIMPEAIPGAIALYIVANALSILAPALKLMGSMSWEGIAKSLVLLGAAFVVLAAGGLLIEAAIPGLLGLGAAVLLLGGGVYLAGAGVSLFAAGLHVLAGEINGLGDQLSKSGPSLVKAIETILESMIAAVNKDTPLIVNMFVKMISTVLDALNKNAPKFISSAANLMIAILNGIAMKLPAIIAAGTSVIVAFITGISNNMGRVLQSAASLVINFINQLATTIRGNSKAMGQAGGNLATAIIEGMVNGLAAGVGKVVSEAENIAGSVLSAAKHVLDSHSPSREFIKIGNDVNNGFAIGLKGNRAQVDNAFKWLQDQLTQTIGSNQSQLDSLETKLKRLESARHRNRSEISATKSEITTLLTERKKEIAALDEVNKGLAKQHTALDALKNKYADVTTKLDAANKSLAAAIKTRDDYNKQITDQYNTDPQFTASTTLAAYETGLESQIEKTKEFANVMQRLRKEGLGDGAYKELLAEGIAALPMAQQLLDSGKNGINQINSDYAQLSSAATALGKTASNDLYQAAVNSAQGLVDGLKKQQAALEKQMEILADAMVNAIKKKLGIRSPSTVFAEVGGFSAQGIAKGLDEMSDIVEKSAANVGQKAIDSLSNTLSGISAVVTKNMDVRPTITPVLDLSGVKKTATQIGDMLQPSSLSLQSAYAKALNASAGHMTQSSALAAAMRPHTGGQSANSPITFVQNNTSPTALSAADIYRQTKNQLSQLRGVLVYQSGDPQQ